MLACQGVEGVEGVEGTGGAGVSAPFSPSLITIHCLHHATPRQSQTTFVQWHANNHMYLAKRCFALRWGIDPHRDELPPYPPQLPPHLVNNDNVRRALDREVGDGLLRF